MTEQNVAFALEQLQTSTDRLIALTAGHLDLNALERAVRERETAISGLGVLVAQEPDSFRKEDLDVLRTCLASGKSAYERIVTSRGRGWTVSTELSQNQYVLRTISQFGTEFAEPHEA